MGKKSGWNARSKVAEDESEEEENKSFQLPQWVKDNTPDTLGLCAGLAVIMMMSCLGLLLVINSQGDIEPLIAKMAPVEILDRAQDIPRSARRPDKEDLTEASKAIEAVERAVRQGNLAGAKTVLQHLEAQGVLAAADVESLKEMVSMAERQNPIANLDKCRPQDLLGWVAGKGGAVVKGKKSDHMIMLVDFDDSRSEEADQRGRGIAALGEIKEGEKLLEVPDTLWLSASYGSSSDLSTVFRENQSLLRDFNGLVMTLLYESHKAGGKFWEYACSLPLHVPLPFLWTDEELPTDFSADAELMEHRRVWKDVVDQSYNATVPVLLEKHGDLFNQDMVIPEKWAWACSIVISRAIAVKTTSGMFGKSHSIANTTEFKNPHYIMDQLNGAKQDDSVHLVLLPAVDMLNHAFSDEATAKLEIKDGKAVLVAGKGLEHGIEVSISYGDEMCGVKPLNTYGFVWISCDSEPEAAASPDAPKEASTDSATETKTEL